MGAARCRPHPILDHNLFDPLGEAQLQDTGEMGSAAEQHPSTTHVSVGSESVIRRSWLNVRLTRERTWPVIYEYTPETELARFAYDNWTDLLYAPLWAD